MVEGVTGKRKLFARADGTTYSTEAEDRREVPESKAGRDRDSKKVTMG